MCVKPQGLPVDDPKVRRPMGPIIFLSLSLFGLLGGVGLYLLLQRLDFPGWGCLFIAVLFAGAAALGGYLPMIQPQTLPSAIDPNRGKEVPHA